MEYIKRNLEDTITSYLQSSNDQILLLSGARQTGKSTLVENLPCKEKKIIINHVEVESPNTAGFLRQF